MLWFPESTIRMRGPFKAEKFLMQMESRFAKLRIKCDIWYISIKWQINEIDT